MSPVQRPTQVPVTVRSASVSAIGVRIRVCVPIGIRVGVTVLGAGVCVLRLVAGASGKNTRSNHPELHSPSARRRIRWETSGMSHHVTRGHRSRLVPAGTTSDTPPKCDAVSRFRRKPLGFRRRLPVFVAVVLSGCEVGLPPSVEAPEGPPLGIAASYHGVLLDTENQPIVLSQEGVIALQNELLALLIEASPEARAAVDTVATFDLDPAERIATNVRLFGSLVDRDAHPHHGNYGPTPPACSKATRSRSPGSRSTSGTVTRRSPQPSKPSRSETSSIPANHLLRRQVPPRTIPGTSGLARRAVRSQGPTSRTTSRSL